MRDNIPSKETVAFLRERYPAGTRVELISMDDPHTTLRPGDKGRVSAVDDIGTIFVDWDNGSGLGIVYGEDSVKKIENEKQFGNVQTHEAVRKLAPEILSDEKPSVMKQIREARQAPLVPHKAKDRGKQEGPEL